MKPYNINNHEDLKAHINALKKQNTDQKEAINTSTSKLRSIFSSGSILKQTSEFPTNKNSNLTKTGLNIGSEFLIDQIWGRHKSIMSFISAFTVRRISNLLINKGKFILQIIGIKNKKTHQ